MQAGSVMGNLASAVLNFLIIGFVAWRLSKLFVKEPAPAEVPATRMCPYCRMTIDAAATRCPHCTSALTEGASLEPLGRGATPVRG